MRNRFFIFIICLIFISIGNAASCYMNEESLKISTSEELIAFAESVNGGNSYCGKIIKLSSDIWLNDTTGWKKWDRKTKMSVWTPIGNKKAPFEGIFDGGGHSIFGLFIKASPENFYQGLFGCLQRATVKDIHIRFSHIIAYNFVGAIAGYISFNSLIINCSNEALVVADRNCVGGLVGFSEGQNRIIACSNYARIYGHRCVGGIVGYFEGGSIYNSFNRGEIAGKYEHIGGIVGEYSEPYQKTVKYTGLHSLPNDTLANCYNTGKIIGRDAVAGIAGHICLYPVEKTTWKVLFANNYNAGGIWSSYPIVTDGLVGVYAYFTDSQELLIPTINRIERDGNACYWNEESCKVTSIEKPRFESDKISSGAWSEVCYGMMKIPKSFRYFRSDEMRQQSFIDLLNEWVDKKDVFSKWSLDKEKINQGFPVF